MAFSQGYVFGFAAAVCVICSLAISTVSSSLRPQQEANARRDEQGNILQALGLNDGTLRGEAIDQVWNERVEVRVLTAAGEPAVPGSHDLDGDGDVDLDDVAVARERVKASSDPAELIGVYVRKDGASVGMYALPMFGVGLWGPISGFLAIDPQGRKVTGATFFAPKETPGLGAEIVEDKFESQFIGKSIVDAAGKTRAIDVVKGESAVLCPGETEHCVDGVSGATITSRGVDGMLASGMQTYEPWLARIRGGSR